VGYKQELLPEQGLERLWKGQGKKRLKAEYGA
jgi:hypothetical protein